jgi:hypothetical protein
MNVRKIERITRFDGTENEGARWYIVTDRIAAVQFAILHYPPVPGLEGMFEGPLSLGAHLKGEPVMAMDLGYHSPASMYDGQFSMLCPVVDAGACFYDGSALPAAALLRAWADAGGDDEWIWDWLELHHREQFGGELE